MTAATHRRMANEASGTGGGPHVFLRAEDMAGTGTANAGPSLIARAEALNHFMRMQPAANRAAMRQQQSSRRLPMDQRGANDDTSGGCFCFGGSSGGGGGGDGYNGGNVGGNMRERQRVREYYPDNLSVQPKKHPWSPSMEWLILGCVQFLERNGLSEPNLFAVSAVDDHVRDLKLQQGLSLPKMTDPHVAAGAIKMQIRQATEPLVPKEGLKDFIEAEGLEAQKKDEMGSEGDRDSMKAPQAKKSFKTSHLAKTIETITREFSPRRAYIFARFMLLLGRVSANVAESRMNAHCLAKCVAPSMLHWDPNSNYALLMLGKITAYVMAMIEDARIYDELLCDYCDNHPHS